MLTNIHRQSTAFAMTAQGWWLNDSGVVVGYAKWMIHRDSPASLILCDIEVRPKFRRHGVATKMIGAIEALEHKPMHASGSYTPLGAKALPRHLKLLPGSESDIKFRAISFVRNWDKMIPRYPLD